MRLRHRTGDSETPPSPAEPSSSGSSSSASASGVASDSAAAPGLAAASGAHSDSAAASGSAAAPGTRSDSDGVAAQAKAAGDEAAGARAGDARTGDASAVEARAKGAEDFENRPVPPDAGPDKPTDLHMQGLMAAAKRTFKQFSTKNISDWAAALTYYGVLSIFPGALVLVSIVGLLGPDGRQTVEKTIADLTSSSQIQDLVGTVLDQVNDSGTASFTAIIGIVLAFWSASGYIAAFMRASNAVYDVPEGRPVWKTLPIRVGVTAVIGLMLIASALIVVFTGRLAEVVGSGLGFGGVAVNVWGIAKWPVLIMLISLMFAILYWASPNAKTGGFRWVSPGGIFAVILWLAASGAFAFYLASFANYNKTYGTLGGVIAFLVWLWISNIAILLGAELDAELERGRAIAAGHDPDDEPFLELRDDRKLKKGTEKALRAD
jgi:membrane protein